MKPVLISKRGLGSINRGLRPFLLARTAKITSLRDQHYPFLPLLILCAMKPSYWPLLLFLMVSCNPGNHDEAMVAHLNGYIDTYLNEQDDALLSTHVAEGFEKKVNDVQVASNREELRAYTNTLFTGFPNLKVVVTTTWTKDREAIIQWMVTGTNAGEFAEMAATGKKVVLSGISHFYFNQDGLLYREEVFYNELALVQQLGYTLHPPILQ